MTAIRYNSEMNTSENKRTAVLVSGLILLAFCILGTNNPNAKVLSMSLEVLSGLAVIGIAVLMFPLLKPYGAKLAIGYLILKGVEGIFAITGGVLFLLHSPSLLALRDQIYLLHGYVYAIPALLFYILLYKSKLIPRFLSIWGIVATILLIIVNLLELVELIPKLEVLYLPIVLNEVVLAIWLMTKGFSPTTTAQL